MRERERERESEHTHTKTYIMKNSIEALVSACSDEDPPVRLSARDALLSASNVHATVVMRSLRKWLEENKSSKNLSSTMHVLNVTRDVVQETLEGKQRDLDSISENLVEVTMKELMRTGLKPIPPKAESPNANVENAARNCLVALSMRVPDMVCDSLLDKMKIKSGKQVPRAIVETIGSVAEENPKGFTSKAREVFSEISPMLGTMKVPSLRSVAANALARCCEAVIENDTMSFTSEALAVYVVFEHEAREFQQSFLFFHLSVVSLQITRISLAHTVQEKITRKPTLENGILCYYDNEYLTRARTQV